MYVPQAGGLCWKEWSIPVDTVFGSTQSMAKKVSDHYPVYGVFYVNGDGD